MIRLIKLSKLPTIILIRHGQTEWNVEGRYQGQLNSSLTEKGQKQAQKNALKISNYIEEEAYIFVSSPLGRAVQTAKIIAHTLDIPLEKIVYEERIKEVNYGIFEGKTKEYCHLHYGKEFEAREADKWSYVLEGGESYEMVTERLKKWLESVRHEKLIIMVAHEMINRALRGLYLELDHGVMLKLRQGNDLIFKLENKSEVILN